MNDVRLDLDDPGIHIKTSGELDSPEYEPLDIAKKPKNKKRLQANWADYPENHADGNYISTASPRRSDEDWREKMERDAIASDVPLDQIFRR